MVEEYKEVRSRVSKSSMINPLKCVKDFCANNPDFNLVFTDASFDPDNGRSACGLVQMSEKGDLLNFKAISLGILDLALEAKLIAIKVGLEEARKGGAKRVGIFSNCLEVVKAINEKDQLWCRGGYTLNIIQKELLSSTDCYFSHILREYNSIAHLLARLGSSPADLPDWIGNKVNEWVQDLWLNLFSHR